MSRGEVFNAKNEGHHEFRASRHLGFRLVILRFEAILKRINSAAQYTYSNPVALEAVEPPRSRNLRLSGILKVNDDLSLKLDSSRAQKNVAAVAVEFVKGKLRKEMRQNNWFCSLALSGTLHPTTHCFPPKVPLNGHSVAVLFDVAAALRKKLPVMVPSRGGDDVDEKPLSPKTPNDDVITVASTSSAGESLNEPKTTEETANGKSKQKKEAKKAETSLYRPTPPFSCKPAYALILMSLTVVLIVAAVTVVYDYQPAFLFGRNNDTKIHPRSGKIGAVVEDALETNRAT
ncbi:unnamed protein product [Caenorhabditis auriculariae]|uniref:Uncharacterized protein n=1 Tax=Caenorhabditis auriculariae TaxID=2777116 RepID=A0A8S1GRL1_9PELO|nr:unnamed protein product [Caenorhabditis auriculariae]